MRLSDIMGAANLSVYAELAMILFLAAFVVIMIAIFAPGRKHTYDAASRMPLDDEHPQTPR
ncbi:MAG: cbb3-type cytochrome c oxidase subunit 3 [Gemmatimonadetes bacterium]|jgi:cbb3-type cytochrome oxidase subunit 3|nr:cbb3-type cytochrome c oxidase subunit 3 [Gemmatimonadota bacterium]